nr:hypothetical protein [Kibdelosporangium sp. MJ126-NF4]CTQ90631.1 hypothetical protein [Kibdelosporangium sp. MJ126-NF4]
MAIRLLLRQPEVQTTPQRSQNSTDAGAARNLGVLLAAARSVERVGDGTDRVDRGHDKVT